MRTADGAWLEAVPTRPGSRLAIPVSTEAGRPSYAETYDDPGHPVYEMAFSGKFALLDDSARHANDECAAFDVVPNRLHESDQMTGRGVGASMTQLWRTTLRQVARSRISELRVRATRQALAKSSTAKHKARTPDRIPRAAYEVRHT